MPIAVARDASGASDEIIISIINIRWRPHREAQERAKMCIWGDYSIPNPRRRFVSGAFVFVHANRRRYRRANFLVAGPPSLFFRPVESETAGERDRPRCASKQPVLRAPASPLVFADPRMEYTRGRGDELSAGETGRFGRRGGTAVVSPIGKWRRSLAPALANGG